MHMTEQQKQSVWFIFGWVAIVAFGIGFWILVSLGVLKMIAGSSLCQ